MTRPGGTGVAPLAGLEVVVAEDDADLLQWAARALAGAGHRVSTAADGAEALRLCRTIEHVDVLFTDVVMPHLGGLEVAARLSDRHPPLGVVFASGGAGAEVRATIRGIGATLLTKPYTAAELLAAVEAAATAPFDGGAGR